MQTPSSEPAPARRISTADLPHGDRAGAVRDYLTELMRVEVVPLDPEAPIDYSADLRLTAGASWGGGWSSALASTRTAAFAKEGDDVMLTLPGVPMVIQAPGEDDLEIAPGEAVVFSAARPMRIVHRRTGPTWGLRVPHADIARLVPGLGSAPILALRGETPMLPLLARYGRLLEAEPLAGQAAQQMAARHLQDLVSMTIGASRDFREQTQATSLTAVRLRNLRADIADHLSRPNLNLTWIAARQGVSVRHLQRLLARNGLSFSDMLRRARVERARALLEDPRNARRTILSVALETGFAEASALNRAFRQEYGLRPSDLR